LSNYSRIYIQDEVSRVAGVGQAVTFGGLQFAMLVSLDADRRAPLGLTVTDVINAIAEQNATHPAGRIGREPAPVGTQFTIPLTAGGGRCPPQQLDNTSS